MTLFLSHPSLHPLSLLPFFFFTESELSFLTLCISSVDCQISREAEKVNRVASSVLFSLPLSLSCNSSTQTHTRTHTMSLCECEPEWLQSVIPITMSVTARLHFLVCLPFLFTLRHIVRKDECTRRTSCVRLGLPCTR